MAESKFFFKGLLISIETLHPELYKMFRYFLDLEKEFAIDFSETICVVFEILLTATCAEIAV